MIGNMICLNCDNEGFSPGEAEVPQEFKGETLMVKTPVVICTNCGWHTVGNDQIDELRRRTADAYRKHHNLLTSAQIKALRHSLRMTQRQFADFLRVGEASVKRWETWLVQDASSDELMRVKCIMVKRAEAFSRLRNEFVSHLRHTAARTDWISVANQSKSLLTGISRYVTLTGKPMLPVSLLDLAKAAVVQSYFSSLGKKFITSAGDVNPYPLWPRYDTADETTTSPNRSTAQNTLVLNRLEKSENQLMPAGSATREVLDKPEERQYDTDFALAA